MRTNLSKDQVTAMIHTFFFDQGSTINFMMYDIDEDECTFDGVIVDYNGDVELPPEEIDV